MKTKLVFVLIIAISFCIVNCKEKKEDKVEEVSAIEVESPSKPELKTITVNNYDFNYLDVGEGEPVVFVHGTVGDYRVWEEQINVFAKKYRVIALSRRFAYPNNQQVNDSTDYTVTAHSKDLIEFLKTLNIGPVHLIGHSYGAFTSLLTTLENPQLVKSLTLGEPPVMSFLQYIHDGEKIGNDFAKKGFIPAAEAFKNNNDKKAVEIFIGAVLEDSLFFSKATKEQQNLMTDNITELKGVIFTENLFPPLACEDVKKIHVPTLLIKGDRSPEILVKISDELNKCIKESELAILPNSSHGLEYENPIEFNKIVLEFINKH